MRKSWMAGLIAVLVIAAVATGLGVILATSQAAEITVPYVQGSLPMDPDAQLWGQLDKTQIPLAAQLIVYPLSLDTKARSLSVAAAHNGTHFAIYIEWSDDTMDVEGAAGDLSSFGDAVAVQFPVNTGALPYVCMGDTANPVNIVFWRAGKGVENLVAGSAYGQKPGQREALGLQSTATSPIEKLSQEAQIWKAEAKFENGSWKLVLIRPMGSTDPMVPNLKPGESISVAFARWEGSLHERGGSKTTSGWYTLKLEGVAAPTPTPTQTTTITETTTSTTTVKVIPPAIKGAVVGLIAALAITIIALIVFVARKKALST